MISLLLFHLCGVGRTIRSIAWSLLVISCLYVGSSLIVVSAVSAASTVILDSLQALEVLEYHDGYETLFDGNNSVVFDILQQTYQDGDDIRSFDRFVEAFGSINSVEWSHYDIDQAEVMIVLKSIQVILERTTPVSDAQDTSSVGGLPYDYTIRTIDHEDGTLIVLETDSTVLPKRMNWYWGDGSRYSCERDQCRRINHLYTTPGTYTIDIYSSMRMHDHEVKSFELTIQ